MSKRKYEKLFYRNRPERGALFIDGTYKENVNKEVHGVGFRGACQIPGSQANIGGSLVTEPIFIDPYPHKHPADEYLAFLGPPENRYDFDACIEFTLGLGEDAEMYVIDRPTIVRIPANVWHCPLNFVRIGRPVFFQVALLQGIFGGTYLMPDGEKELYYNGQIDCIMDPGKQCNACRQCLTLDWRD
ncbi:MAG: hypothetical protein QM368_06810 [Bacillota bacterium]|nr:hypothetical protein [Bacillota bacterium]HHU30578.1 hypothetical protein [Bacillota bacterium]